MYYSFIAPSALQQVLGYVCSLLSNVIKLKLFSALILLAHSPGCWVLLSQMPFCFQFWLWCNCFTAFGWLYLDLSMVLYFTVIALSLVIRLLGSLDIAVIVDIADFGVSDTADIAVIVDIAVIHCGHCGHCCHCGHCGHCGIVDIAPVFVCWVMWVSAFACAGRMACVMFVSPSMRLSFCVWCDRTKQFVSIRMWMWLLSRQIIGQWHSIMV